MKKRVLFILGLFLIALLAGIISAAENDLENITEEERVNLAYNCLENEINKTGCERLSLEEQIFSLLSMGKCYDEVMEESRLKECWPKTGCDIKTTSMAILALDNFKKNTEEAQVWLISQNKTPESIIWYLQIEAPEETNCTLNASQEEYKIKISSEEKIKEDEGPSNCFSVDNDYRIKINKNCYNKDLKISCDSSFKFSLLFKKEDSSRLFISDTTKGGSKDEEVDLRINSLCFSKGTMCEYEENLWANLALDVTENKISSYLPYLISLKEDNKKYLPESFLYFLTKDNDYYSELISKQSSEGYWKSNENQYYDTSIALFPLVNENSEEKEKAKQWLLDEQGDTGCWEGWDIEKTAFILFSVWPKYPFEKTSELKIPKTENESSEDSSEERLICEEYGGFCMSNSECENSGGEILNEYLCKGWDSCCTKESNQEQEDNSNDKQETTPPKTEKSECEEKGYSCEISCDEGYIETKIYECSSSNLRCCKPQESLPKQENKSYWWIWVLLLLIILVVLGILFRDKLKEFLIKIKSKKGNNKGESSSSGGRPPYIPPRGPPSSPSRNIRRPIPPQNRMSPPNKRKPSRPIIRKPLPNSKNKELDDVLNKLKEMGN